MARSGTAEQHQVAQAGLAAATGPLVLAAWAHLLDLHDLKGSVPRLAAALRSILAQYGRASASAGLTYYRNERRAAGVTGRVHLSLPPLPSNAEVTAAVEHVISPLYGAPDAQAERDARDALASEVEQMVLDQSRQAVMSAAEADREAKGWARVTEPGACSFCRLLATRGAVYGTKVSADFRAHTKQPNGSGGTCRCHVEPVFGHYEPTAQARMDLAEYKRLTDEFGKSGRAIHIAWRQHVEGRPVTGPLRKLA
ncbi:VG15 protein [Nocardioides terrisoli]|uniref:VG15 protein n=1 Tax=Nocardioides terrisoli TaxID=3388267 RepID=UPI00287BC35C|nr:hypothetical protein [Nocardioides marmorisolisilvae]